MSDEQRRWIENATDRDWDKLDWFKLRAAERVAIAEGIEFPAYAKEAMQRRSDEIKEGFNALNGKSWANCRSNI